MPASGRLRPVPRVRIGGCTVCVCPYGGLENMVTRSLDVCRRAKEGDSHWPHGRLAAGSGTYLARKSRDIRGSEATSKIAPEASSPANKGPPRFGTRRSVKPSAQPTLVRTQHPPPEISQLLIGKLSPPPMGREQQTERSTEPSARLPASTARIICRKYPGYIGLNRAQIALR
jgi:hypothetical protein